MSPIFYKLSTCTKRLQRSSSSSRSSSSAVLLSARALTRRTSRSWGMMSSSSAKHHFHVRIGFWPRDVPEYGLVASFQLLHCSSFRGRSHATYEPFLRHDVLFLREASLSWTDRVLASGSSQVRTRGLVPAPPLFVFPRALSRDVRAVLGV